MQIDKIAHIPYDCYLHIQELRSGEVWVQEIKPHWILDLKTRIQHFLKTEFGGEVKLAGDPMIKIDGDYYATIYTDNRQPDGCVCWTGGGFYTKSAY